MKDQQQLNRRFKSSVGKAMRRAGFLKSFLIMIGAACIVAVNNVTLHSPLIGISASLAYFVVGGYSLRKVFSGKNRSVIFALGSLLLVMLLGLIGWVFTITYKLGVIEVLISLCVVAFFVSLVQRLTKDRHVTAKTEHERVKLDVRFLEAIFIALTCLQLLLLWQSRTTIPIVVLDNLKPLVMPVFFFNTLLLITIVFSGERWQTSLLLIVIQSISLHMFFVLVFDPGYGSDQWGWLGWTRRLFDESQYPQGVFYGLHSPGSLLFKIYRSIQGPFQMALSTMLSRMFSVDVFWGHLLLVPLMWGIFVPVVAYYITEIITRKQALALLSALLTLATPPLILWGAVSVPNSLGYIFFFFTMCLLVDYLSSDRTMLWVALSSFVTLLGHIGPGTIAFSLLFFAYAFKRYPRLKHENVGKILLGCVFLGSVSILPLISYSARMAYPALTGADFTLKPLEGLSAFDAIMLVLVGAYADFTLKEVIVHGLLPLFGLLGLLYVNMTGNKFMHNRELSRFLLFAFILVIVNYTITKCFMVNSPFGPERIWLIRDMLSIPFASILMYKIVANLSSLTPNGNKVAKKVFKEFAGGSFRRDTLRAMTVLCLAALIMSSVYLGYTTVRITWATSQEVQAAKFIHSTADRPYVVVCDMFFRHAGFTVAGANNPMAYYSRRWDFGWLERLFDEVRGGSATAMIEASQINDASTTFFAINKLRSKDADTVVELLLERGDFQIYGVFGDVTILRYIPPLKRFVEGTGPSVYVHSLQQYVNTSSVLDMVTYEAHYEIELIGSSNYSITSWPLYWSFESITPEPIIRPVDANLWINFTGHENVTYIVSWTAHEWYQLVGWKDDSFVSGWTPRLLGTFTETPLIIGDGDTISITGIFQKAARDYYWIQKPVNISTNLYRYVLVRWKSTSYNAIAWVYYTDLTSQPILPYASESDDWTTTIVKLPEGKTISTLMVGLDDYTRIYVDGVHSAYFDFIMLANKTWTRY